jgi:hypothetical protein
VLRIIGCLVVSAFIVACNPCRDRVLARYQSPDGGRQAIVVERDCGATSDYIQHVRISTRATETSAAEGASVFAVTGRQQLTVRWLDARSLAITWEGTTTARGKRFFEDISISYEPALSVSQIAD